MMAALGRLVGMFEVRSRFPRRSPPERLAEKVL